MALVPRGPVNHAAVDGVDGHKKHGLIVPAHRAVLKLVGHGANQRPCENQHIAAVHMHHCIYTKPSTVLFLFQ